MSTTYSGNPASSDRDAVRFRIGDTQESDWQLQDEEIDYLLEGGVSVPLASLRACKALAAHYARQVDKSVDGFSLSASQRQTHYLDLAKTISREAGLDVPAVSFRVGGLSIADRDTADADEDLIQPDFRIGQFDDSRVSPTTPGRPTR